MNALPLVSILTASYNHSEYLDEYFHSLLEQTYENIELVFIDDVSSDNTWEKTLSFQSRLEAKLSKVILLRNPENRGLVHTLAKLKDYPTGQFIGILESDDRYKPDMLTTSFNYLNDHPTFGAVHCEVDFQYPTHIEENHWANLGRTLPEGDIYERLLKDNIILTCSFLCRVELFKKYVDFNKYLERGYLTADYPMFLDMARHTHFGYIDQSLAIYRVVPDSISHPRDIKKQFKWKEAYYHIKRDYIQEFGASPEVTARANKQYHRNLMEAGYALFNKEKFHRGYNWLISHYPKEFSRYVYRLQKLGMKSRIIWVFTRKIESIWRLARL